jgi:hypothetical protein
MYRNGGSGVGVEGGWGWAELFSGAPSPLEGRARCSRSLSVVDQAQGFGSSSGRPRVPGPGCYDIRVGLADSVAAAAVRPSAVSPGVGNSSIVAGRC